MNDWFFDNLTPKQAEYVALLASGLSTLEISQRNFISHHTVRNTITKAKERVNSTSTANLIATAVSKQWIVPEDDEMPMVFVAADNE